MAKRRADRGSFRERRNALYWRGQLPEKTESGEIVWRPVSEALELLTQQRRGKSSTHGGKKPSQPSQSQSRNRQPRFSSPMQ